MSVVNELLTLYSSLSLFLWPIEFTGKNVKKREIIDGDTTERLQYKTLGVQIYCYIDAYTHRPIDGERKRKGIREKKKRNERK